MPITDQSAEATRDFARALIDTSLLPLLLLDGEGRVVSSSRSFHRASGVAAEDAKGRNLADLSGGGWDTAPLAALLANALTNGPSMDGYELDLIREDLRPRRLQVNIQTVIHGAAPDIRVLMAITDVTEARDAEKLNIALLLEKDDLLRERDELMDEMQHRIANSLQIIASILLLKARAVASEETRSHLQDAHHRVLSLAAVQQHLQFTLGNIDIAPYLTKLCASVAESMIGEARGLGIQVVADDAVIHSREAVSLGLVATELVINALKHAFPDGRVGMIHVNYRVRPQGWVLSVADDGVGPPDPPMPTKGGGLGTSIIAGLARQLNATVSVTHTAPGMMVAVTGLEAEMV